jgi:hypothetical protein
MLRNTRCVRAGVAGVTGVGHTATDAVQMAVPDQLRCRWLCRCTTAAPQYVVWQWSAGAVDDAATGPICKTAAAGLYHTQHSTPIPGPYHTQHSKP